MRKGEQKRSERGAVDKGSRAAKGETSPPTVSKPKPVGFKPSSESDQQSERRVHQERGGKVHG